MKELVYVNPNKKDNCEVCKLNPNWKKVLLNYIMAKFKIRPYDDYEDIYDNIDDYEYPYNHINRSDL